MASRMLYLQFVKKEQENVMNIKNFFAALATITTIATSTAAMADVRYSGDAGFTVQGGVTVRDHRSVQPVYAHPVIKHTRHPSRWWETEYQEPVVVQQSQPDYITCNATAWPPDAQATDT